MANGHGGVRPNSGRPRGVRNSVPRVANVAQQPKEDIRAWDERLRMPQFTWADDPEAIQEVMTFVLGLTGEKIATKYLFLVFLVAIVLLCVIWACAQWSGSGLFEPLPGDRGPIYLDPSGRPI